MSTTSTSTDSGTGVDDVERTLPVAPPALPVTPCAPVTVAIIATGAKASLNFVPMFKSLLFYRTRPIHLHLLVDEYSQPSLELLFKTWNIPYLRVSYINATPLLDEVVSIPTWHYAGRFPMLKLLLERVLPSVSRIIALDMDIVLQADIGLLWDHFGAFSDESEADESTAGVSSGDDMKARDASLFKQCIGLVENESDWYLGKLKVKMPWPAIGRGFNTGVMLMHLDRLRALRFNDLWHDVTRAVFATRSPKLRKTHLADQDIINALVKTHPALLYRLPCEWNVQLSDNSKAHESCVVKSGRVGVRKRLCTIT